ncbi:hypothetical protein CDAR_186501 [Caerostris darwini]|uniref:Uncharacterized protein n=1 Tax=Caerostris darwini TaxID=1538125 RepID=A0AAV4VV92_9ARAC|nr:hypothetical protein CDAR_186501 [Caerostris darwini]
MVFRLIFLNSKTPCANYQAIPCLFPIVKLYNNNTATKPPASDKKIDDWKISTILSKKTTSTASNQNRAVKTNRKSVFPNQTRRKTSPTRAGIKTSGTCRAKQFHLLPPLTDTRVSRRRQPKPPPVFILVNARLFRNGAFFNTSGERRSSSGEEEKEIWFVFAMVDVSLDALDVYAVKVVCSSTLHLVVD